MGAILIGYFGVVHEAPHSLDDLLALFSRPAFVAFSSILMLCIVGVLVIVSKSQSICLADTYEIRVVSLGRVAALRASFKAKRFTTS